MPIALSWVGTGVFFALALVAGLGDRRRKRRVVVDRVGWVDWPVVQLLALFGLVVCIALALSR